MPGSKEIFLSGNHHGFPPSAVSLEILSCSTVLFIAFFNILCVLSYNKVERLSILFSLFSFIYDRVERLSILF